MFFIIFKNLSLKNVTLKNIYFNVLIFEKYTNTGLFS